MAQLAPTLQLADERWQELDRRLSGLEAKVLEIAGIAHALIRRQVVVLDDGFAGIRSPHGWYVVPQEEYRSVLHLADGTSGHEPGTLAVLRKIVHPGDVAIDAGAHVGLLSLPLAQMVGPEGRLIALEPNPRTAESLRRTLASNLLLEHCDVVEVAASDFDDVADFFLGANSMLGSLVVHGDGDRSIPVRTVTLDSMLPVGARVDVIKMDVEGAETRVLSGMRRVVANNPDILVVAEFGPSHLERIGISPEDWFAAFAAVGLDQFFQIDEASGACVQAGISDLAQRFSVNILFGRSGNPRLQAVLPQSSHG